MFRAYGNGGALKSPFGARPCAWRRSLVSVARFCHNPPRGKPGPSPHGVARPMFGFSKHRSEHPRIAQIRQLGLFATLRPRELRVIDGLLHEREYLEGEIVFDSGEEGQALYVVLRGRVLICRQGEPVTGRMAEIPAGAL